MRIHKNELFNNKEKEFTPDERNFIFITGAFSYDAPEWIQENISSEILGLNYKLDIPKNVHTFVIPVISDSKLGDVDKAVIDYADEHTLDYVLINVDDSDLARFLKDICGFALIFGEPTKDAFLARIIIDLERLNVHYNLYDDEIT